MRSLFPSTHTNTHKPTQVLCCHVRKKAAAEAFSRNRKCVCVTHPRRGSADCEQQPLCMKGLAAAQPLRPSSFPEAGNSGVNSGTFVLFFL